MEPPFVTTGFSHGGDLYYDEVAQWELQEFVNYKQILIRENTKNIEYACCHYEAIVSYFDWLNNWTQEQYYVKMVRHSISSSFMNILLINIPNLISQST